MVLVELNGLARKLPNQIMLVNSIALREAKASTAMENIFTTDDELYKSLTVKENDLIGNAKEVLFYRQALWAGFQKVKAVGKFDKDLIIDIYRKIKQVEDGLRTLIIQSLKSKAHPQLRETP